MKNRLGIKPLVCAVALISGASYAAIFNTDKCYYESHLNSMFCEDKTHDKGPQTFDKIEFNIANERIILHNTLNSTQKYIVKDYNVPLNFKWNIDSQYFMQLMQNSWVDVKEVESKQGKEFKINIHGKMNGGMWDGNGFGSSNNNSWSTPSYSPTPPMYNKPHLTPMRPIEPVKPWGNSNSSQEGYRLDMQRYNNEVYSYNTKVRENKEYDDNYTFKMMAYNSDRLREQERRREEERRNRYKPLDLKLESRDDSRKSMFDNDALSNRPFNNNGSCRTF